MSKRIPLEVKDKVRLLRKKGYSLPEIVREVKIGHGSVFRYIQGVEIEKKHRKFWFGKRGGSKKRKALAEQLALQKAKQLINSLSDKERLIFFSALYWGEGSKKDFGLSNSDPDLIRILVKCLEKVLKIRKERLKVSIRIYEDMDEEKCLKFWSRVVGIPVNKFVSVNILSGKKKGKLAYGMCRIRVSRGSDMLKYTNALKKAVSELF